MRVQGIAHAQMEVSQMMVESGVQSADRARKKETTARIEAAEKQEEAAAEKAKGAWTGAAIQIVTTVLTSVAQIASLGATTGITIAKATLDILKTVASVMASIAQALGGVLGAVFGGKESKKMHEARELQLDAEKAKEVADRNEQRASRAQQQQIENRRGLGQQARELRNAVSLRA